MGSESWTRVVLPGSMHCPLCGTEVARMLHHLSEGEEIWLNWGTVIHEPPRVTAWTLHPCGCELSSDEWTWVALCDSLTRDSQPPYARYYWCHPDEMENLIARLRQRD